VSGEVQNFLTCEVQRRGPRQQGLSDAVGILSLSAQLSQWWLSLQEASVPRLLIAPNLIQWLQAAAETLSLVAGPNLRTDLGSWSAQKQTLQPGKYIVMVRPVSNEHLSVGTAYPSRPASGSRVANSTWGRKQRRSTNWWFRLQPKPSIHTHPYPSINHSLPLSPPSTAATLMSWAHLRLNVKRHIAQNSKSCHFLESPGVIRDWWTGSSLVIHSGLNCAPKSCILFVIPRPYLKRGLCRCNWVPDLKMRSASWLGKAPKSTA
jgi:hypothetical protein